MLGFRILYMLTFLLLNLSPLNDITLLPVITYTALLSLLYFLSFVLLLPVFLRCTILTLSRFITFEHYYIILILLYLFYSCSCTYTYLLLTNVPFATAFWLKKYILKLFFYTFCLKLIHVKKSFAKCIFFGSMFFLEPSSTMFYRH